MTCTQPLLPPPPYNNAIYTRKRYLVVARLGHTPSSPSLFHPYPSHSCPLHPRHSLSCPSHSCLLHSRHSLSCPSHLCLLHPRSSHLRPSNLYPSHSHLSHPRPAPQHFFPPGHPSWSQPDYSASRVPDQSLCWTVLWAVTSGVSALKEQLLVCWQSVKSPASVSAENHQSHWFLGWYFCRVADHHDYQSCSL